MRMMTRVIKVRNSLCSSKHGTKIVRILPYIQTAYTIYGHGICQILCNMGSVATHDNIRHILCISKVIRDLYMAGYVQFLCRESDICVLTFAFFPHRFSTQNKPSRAFLYVHYESPWLGKFNFQICSLETAQTLHFCLGYKIRPLIDHFNAAFVGALSPDSEQSIDEHMTKFKGKHSCKQ